METKIIKDVDGLDCNNLLGINTNLVCQDIRNLLISKNKELTTIKDIEARTTYYNDLLLFLYTLKNKFSEKINQYNASLTSLYEKNIFPILEKGGYPLVLPHKLLSDIENHVQFTQISLIGFIDYQIQLVLSWTKQNDKNLEELDKEIEKETNRLKLKIEQYERTLYTKESASTKVQLHINSLRRAIKDRNLAGFDTKELDDSMEHYKLLAEEINLNKDFLSASKEETTTIDSERLKQYFRSSFKGMGKNNFDYYSSMIDELKKGRSTKEYAQIALIIYESDKLNDRKPATFLAWYRIFCNCIGCTYSKNYKPSKLKNIPQNLYNLFSYL